MSNIACDKEKVNEMKLHMLILMNVWMMLVLMKCKWQMQCLTLGCYISGVSVHRSRSQMATVKAMTITADN